MARAVSRAVDEHELRIDEPTQVHLHMGVAQARGLAELAATEPHLVAMEAEAARALVDEGVDPLEQAERVLRQLVDARRE